MKLKKFMEVIKGKHKNNMQIILKDHKSSFIVFTFFRILTVIILARQIILGNFESAFFCILTILLLYLPCWVQKSLPIVLPPALEITIFCFIFAAEILGEVSCFYVLVPGWDTMLHTINGFLCAAVGFALITLLNKSERIVFELSPFFIALVSFCFSMTIGVLWEFFEFGADCLLHTDSQKDTVIHAIHSVSLDATRTNSVVSISDIESVTVNGAELGLGGYLDIGLIDTMKDLFVNFIGAVVFCLIGYCCIKGKRFWKPFVAAIIPRRRENRKNGSE